MTAPAAPAPPSTGPRRPALRPLDLVRTTASRAPLLAPLLLLVVALSLATDRFLTGTNLENVLTTASIVVVPGLAMTLCIAMGEFDLSIGSTVSLTGAVTCTWIAGGNPTAVALLVGLVVGALVGLANGLVITKLGVNAFIATLATLVIVRGLSLAYTDGRDVIVNDQFLKYLAAGRPLGVPMPILLAAVVIVLTWWTVNHTRFGRWVCAIGSNRDAAAISGLSVDRIRTAVYVLIGLAGATWGILISGQLQKGSGQLGLGFELDAIAVVVVGGTSLLGGRASVLGTVLGAVFLQVIDNGLNLLNTPPAFQRISVGVVLIAALAIQAIRSNARPEALDDV